MRRLVLIVLLSLAFASPAVAQTCEGVRVPLLTANVSGHVVSLSWSSDGAPKYLFEAGSRPGANNLVRFETVAQRLVVTVGTGTYFVQVRALNACGEPSGPSTYWMVRVPCNEAAPALTHRGNGWLTWTLPRNSEREGYRLEVSSTPGDVDAITFATRFGREFLVGSGLFGFGSRAPGTYFARLRATNACGGTLVSNEVPITVLW